MPGDPEDYRPPFSPVERMINALDEVQDAVDRLAAESRTADRRVARDIAPEEPLSREELLSPRSPFRVPEF